MPTGSMPAAEVHVEEPLVRALLADQHPDLARLPLRRLANGWDNVSFRLGEDLVVRVPRRAAAAELVEHEQRWLPQLAPRLPLPVPVPVRSGRPALGYPWSWSVCRWLDGEPAASSPPSDARTAARELGAFLVALHRPAPDDAPANPFRGVPLAARDATVRDRLTQLEDVVSAAPLEAAWEAALEQPPWRGPALWLHGDLHPLNVLVADGRLAGVIDFGDITAGDPATDLAVAWMLLPAPDREVLRGVCGVDDATWERARGWALLLGLACLAASSDHADLEVVGRRTLRAVLDDR